MYVEVLGGGAELPRIFLGPCRHSPDSCRPDVKSRLQYEPPTRSRFVSASGTQQTALVVMSEIRELGTVLSIWAHPDDEAYLCGGIMAIAAAAGSRVVCVTATRGELGVTDPMRWPPEQLPAIREAEIAACLEILGVKEHRWLGYPDGGCAEADSTQPQSTSQRSFSR